MPEFLNQDERVVGHVFGAPILIKGWSWFPANQILLWGIMSWVARRGHPLWSWGKSIATGGLTSTLILGSEWLHNLAHTATAWRIGKPADGVRIFMGMPLLVYKDKSSAGVSPGEHILRAAGGPLLNACLLFLALILRRYTRPATPARAAADAAVGMNAFLSTASFLPVPGIDGGSIVKWMLVKHGATPIQADTKLVKVNRSQRLGWEPPPGWR
jgi:Zn-dependent protease